MNTTEDMATNRSVEFVGSGTFFTDPGTTLVLAGTVSGTGSFTKAGFGELDLKGEMQAYRGNAAIAAGTLVVSGQFGAVSTSALRAGWQAQALSALPKTLV
ncbi:hypothetical protein AB664_09405 [Brucella anthropi]|uniref:Uncharacterized protein n=1 Tax=Brucella anthropi TaxID=529 RepID=A0A656Z4D8_BRUAN|nr:hypothetical protein AB664_09405 [Brucella anthropi]